MTHHRVDSIKKDQKRQTRQKTKNQLSQRQLVSMSLKTSKLTFEGVKKVQI